MAQKRFIDRCIAFLWLWVPRICAIGMLLTGLGMYYLLLSVPYGGLLAAPYVATGGAFTFMTFWGR